jgi:hypothetical protein
MESTIMLKRLRGLLAGLAFLVPIGSYAQTLDFDSVCATPPCDPASLYAGVGVAISGGGASIVAAGTNGLTGTNGGRFMQVSVFPFQNTITLTRTSVYATLDVARATGTVAGQTFTVQALNNGVPVGAPATVTLGAVNAWSTLVLSVPGGFNGIFLDTALGGATKTYGVDNVRIFGTCNGFSDVLPTDSYCNATEWLANRGVTQGCVAGQYCPANNVTRAQMALFMNRLGDALTPVVQFVDTSPGGIDLDAGQGVSATNVCRTTTFTPVFPRKAVLTGAFSGQSTGAMRFWVWWSYSTDGGVSWTPINNWAQRTASNSTEFASASTSAQLDMAVGRTYLFAITATRDPSDPGGNDITTSRCTLLAQFFGRTGATAPFDHAGDGASQAKDSKP